MLEKILKIGGNPLWVDKAIEFAFDVLPKYGEKPMDDPREIRGILDGKDRLLDGSYQHDLLLIMKAEYDEKETERKHLLLTETSS